MWLIHLGDALARVFIDISERPEDTRFSFVIWFLISALPRKGHCGLSPRSGARPWDCADCEKHPRVSRARTLHGEDASKKPSPESPRYLAAPGPGVEALIAEDTR